MQKRLPKLLMQPEYSWYKHFKLAEAALHYHAWSVLVISCSFICDWLCLYWLWSCADPSASLKLQSATYFWVFHVYNLTCVLKQSHRAKIQSTLTSMTLTLWRSAHLHQHSMNILLACRNKRVHGAVGKPSIWLICNHCQVKLFDSGWRLSWQLSWSWTCQWNDCGYASVAASHGSMLQKLLTQARLMQCVQCNMQLSVVGQNPTLRIRCPLTHCTLLHFPTIWPTEVLRTQYIQCPRPASNTRYGKAAYAWSCWVLVLQVQRRSEAKGGKYLACLTLHGKFKHLGTYTDAEEAAKTVDAAKIFLVKQCMLSIPNVTAASIVHWACKSHRVPQSMQRSCCSWLLHLVLSLP